MTINSLTHLPSSVLLAHFYNMFARLKTPIRHQLQRSLATRVRSSPPPTRKLLQAVDICDFGSNTPPFYRDAFPPLFEGEARKPLPDTTEFREAARNVETVLGISQDALELFNTLTPYASDDFMIVTFHDKVLSWRGVDRGKSLFIEFLPRFNIDEVLDRYLKQNAMNRGTFRSNDLNRVSMYRYHGLTRARLEDWRDAAQRWVNSEKGLIYETTIVRHKFIVTHYLPEPLDLILIGCFPAVISSHSKQLLKDILSQNKECPVRKHLIRYHAWWNDNDHANALDELEMAIDKIDYGMEWPDDWDRLTPPTLLRRMREVDEL
jgi:hypothetical protein